MVWYDLIYHASPHLLALKRHKQARTTNTKAKIMTKLHCYADICMYPLGSPEASISDYIALITKKIEQSPLKSTLHCAGTTIEGPWDEVFELIGELLDYCHSIGLVRMQSNIRVGTRVDKVQHPQDKIDVVLKKMSNYAAAETTVNPFFAP